MSAPTISAASRPAATAAEQYGHLEVSCRVCGCTDRRGCAVGCWWVRDPETAGAWCSVYQPLVLAALTRPDIAAGDTS